MQPVVGPYERLLGKVLRNVEVPHEADHKPVDRVPVPLDQPAVRRAVPTERSSRQIPIVHACHSLLERPLSPKMREVENGYGENQSDLIQGTCRSKRNVGLWKVRAPCPGYIPCRALTPGGFEPAHGGRPGPAALYGTVEWEQPILATRQGRVPEQDRPERSLGSPLPPLPRGILLR